MPSLQHDLGGIDRGFLAARGGDEDGACRWLAGLVFARLARGPALSSKPAVHVGFARAIGVSDRIIMMRHLLPGGLPSVIVYFSMCIGLSILTAASCSVIGLGAQLPSPEWGAMLAGGRRYLGVAGHVTLCPGIAIFVTALAFNLFGDGLRDTLDPKLKRQ